MSRTKEHKPLLEFKNISCVVKERPEPILHDISGTVYESEIAALMGPSGAGKTTLLHILARQEVFGTVTGTTTRHCEGFEIGFVSQQDIFEPFLTTKETMQLYAELMLPSYTTTEERTQKVANLLSELGLAEVADMYVGGNDFSGGAKTLSGGEKRRLSVGVTIVNDPQLIFLDEPTTGLDAGTAMEVMSILRVLTTKGCGIICSIHQPRYDIFREFDQCFFMADGVLVAAGHRVDLLNFYKEIFPHQPMREEDVADLFLDYLSTLNATSAAQVADKWFAFPTAHTRVKTPRDRSKRSFFAARADERPGFIRRTGLLIRFNGP
ncbi:hypothetical protein CYMTET_6145, partial [Cymbomonas tetramitiformis]